MMMALRARLLAAVLLGVVAPLALLGLWLTRSTQRSGEDLLRARLAQSLGATVQAVGHGWVGRRAELLALAENPAVQQALADGRPLAGAGSPEAQARLDAAWAELVDRADAVVFRDANNVVWGELRRPDPRPGAAATVAVTLPVFQGVTAWRIGEMEALLPIESLLPAGLLRAGAAGSVLAIFDGRRGVSLLPELMGPELFGRDRFAWEGEDWLVIRHQLQEPPLLFALAGPLGTFSVPFARAARRGTLALIAVVICALALTVVLTRRMTVPLERLAAAADAISAGDLDRRVETRAGPAEIRRLGAAFNTMSESLRRTLRKLSQREAVTAMGEIAASIAHEVRNPLTSIRLDLERATERLTDPARARPLLERAICDIDRLDATVAGALRLARSGSLTLQTIDLREPLDTAVHAALPFFHARGSHLHAPRLAEPIAVAGNAGALEQLFLNLLRNAAEAIEPGASADIAVERSPDRVRVSVRDDGPGIVAGNLERIFEPFFTTKSEGTGLGLAIARRIAQAHGGELTVESEVGTGTAVHLVLPADGHGASRV